MGSGGGDEWWILRRRIEVGASRRKSRSLSSTGETGVSETCTTRETGLEEGKRGRTNEDLNLQGQSPPIGTGFKNIQGKRET